ncbi:MAG: RES domain-containing protein [Lachnospiraceae bacterium]|nr:RES domain-containing protein [Lachnospiraceae bacterium]
MQGEGNWFSEIIRDEMGKLKKDYVTPITVNSDSNYVPKLKEIMSNLRSSLEEKSEMAMYADIVSNYENYFMHILDAQYAGDLIQAQNVALEILTDLQIGDDSVAFSSLKKSIAFADKENVLVTGEYPLDDERENRIQFYRARTSDTYTKYTRPEMLHVPFSKRQFVSNERFSISGFPCLYLGSSSYCCWLELGTPDAQHFNVSYVELNEEKEILNLTMNALDFEQCVDLGINEKKLVTAFKLWLLCIATSFNVREKGRIFKSEYVISQQIMLACKSSGYYGISYYSKKVKDDRFAELVCVNLVVFALYSGEHSVSEICRDIKLTESMNFEMFKNLRNSLKYRHEHLNVRDSAYPVIIGDFERQYPYNETEFYSFDEYLVAHLKDEVQAIDVRAANRTYF